jgi:glycosyltransferase involved in cell wall biosynthesis
LKILLIQETDWKDKGPHQQHHIIERLVRRGHEARIIDYDICWHEKEDHSVFTQRMEIDMPSKTIDGVTTRLIRPKMIRMPVLCYLSVPIWHTIEILKQIRKFRPHVIIGMSILNTIVALLLSKLMGIPFVYYWIDSYHDLIPEKFLRRIGLMAERFVLRKSDKVLAINDELAAFQIQLGANEKRVGVVAAGIATERFNVDVDGSKVRSMRSVASDETLLLFMGWMYDFSGIREVAQSILKLDESAKIKFMVIGKGDVQEEIREMALLPEAKGRIIMEDWVEYKDLPLYVAASDICLLPAHLNDIMRHIVPIKLYEYMACGKPVIVTKLPGVMKEFGEGNGIVYIDKPDNTIDKVIELIETGMLESLGKRSAEFTRRRGWKDFVDQFTRILIDVSK